MAAFIPAALGLLGGFLSSRSKSNTQQQQYQNDLTAQKAQQQKGYDYGQGTFNKNAEFQAARAQLGLAALAKHDPELFSKLDPALIAKLQSPTAYPNFEFAPESSQPAKPGFGQQIGDALSGAAPFYGLSNQASNPLQAYMKKYYGGSVGGFNGAPFQPSQIPGLGQAVDPSSIGG